MQIHELNRSRRTDEGVWDVVKGVGNVAATGLAQAVSPGVGTTQDFRASSAGILKPAEKLAAVKKNSQMVKLATQYADEWVKKQAQAQAVPEDTAVSTQQELEKQTGRSNPYMTPAAQQPTAPAPVANKTTSAPANAQGFNYNNVVKMPGVANTTTATQAQTPPATGSQVNKAKPDNPNIKDQTRYVQGRAGSGEGGDATKFAKYDPATSAVANAGQGINNMVRGGVAAQQPTAPEKSTGTAMPTTPYQVPGAGTNPNPNATKPGQTATTTTTPAKSTGTSMPLKPFQVPGAGTNPTPTNPIGYKAAAAPSSPYVTDFLKWANEKIAMRDSTTYKMLGLTAAENSGLKAELAAAKQEVIGAQGDPAKTKIAVKNYILTAMAALQLEASKSKVAAASPEAPAYGQQPAPAGQAGKAGQPAGQPGAAGTAPATGQITGSGAVALLTKAGLTAQILGSAGQAIQTVTSNKQLSTTGDSVIDTMLESMGYTVS